jgi:hypothetical protein
VRFDGGHKRDAFLTETFGRFVEWAPVCPEVECRFGAASKRELAETIDDYRRRLVPLVVPLTIIRHHARTLDIAYLTGQTYLEPHPKELMLRNHV